jgi:NhaP-type Na+/H+ and K+/H+ antiporter
MCFARKRNKYKNYLSRVYYNIYKILFAMESLSIDSFCHVHDQKCEKKHDTYLTASNCSFFHELTRTYPTVFTDQFINLPVINALKYDKIYFRYLSTKLKNDKEIVLAAVQQDGKSLEDASHELKNDKEIVLAAVQQAGKSLEDASTELKNDKEIVLAAVQQDGKSLEDASHKLKNDKEVVLAAVTNDGWALRYASKKLKDDREIVLAAIQENEWALEFASDDLKNDKEIVLAAVQQDGWTLEFASDDLKNDEEVVALAASLSIDSFCYVHDHKCEKKHDTYLTASNCSFFRELTRTYPTVFTDQFINLPVINALKYEE